MFPYLKIEGKGQGRLKNLLKFLKQSWDWKPGGVVPGKLTSLSDSFTATHKWACAINAPDDTLLWEQCSPTSQGKFVSLGNCVTVSVY